MRNLITILLVIAFVISKSSISADVGFGLNQTMHTYEYMCEEDNITPISNMTDICLAVTQSKFCKEVPKNDLLDCHSIESKSQVDAWDFLKGCSKGIFNSVKDMLKMVWDIMKWTWENTISLEARVETVIQASEYMAATKLYLNTEYQKALARSTPPMKEMKAIKLMSSAIGNMILNMITETVAEEKREFGCLNFEAKSKFVCKILGDVFIPPAALLGFIKYGLKAVQQFPKLKKLYTKSDSKTKLVKVNNVEGKPEVIVKPKEVPQTEKAPETSSVEKTVIPEFIAAPRLTKFDDLVVEFPALKETMTKISSNLPAKKQISHIREIPYSKSKGFRALSTDEMLIRAETLDPDISKNIVAAYNSLNDPEVLKPYMEGLFKETAERMAKSGRSADLKTLENGVISTQDLAVTLVKRLKERGDTNFTSIQNKENKPLSTGKIKLADEDLQTENARFRAAIKTGPFFDNVFFQKAPSRSNHGAYSHLTQRDIIYESILKSTNGDPKKFWDFLGSKKGIHYWVDLFDSGDENSFTRPEKLMEYMNHSFVSTASKPKK